MVDDGTITGWVLEAPRLLAGQSVLTLALPAGLPNARVAGRYFLARCGATSAAERAEQWETYLRRPLFAVSRGPLHPDAAREFGAHECWQMAAPLTAICAFSRKNKGTPSAAPEPKHTSCRLVRLNMTFVFTAAKSLGTGT